VHVTLGSPSALQSRRPNIHSNRIHGSFVRQHVHIQATHRALFAARYCARPCLFCHRAFGCFLGLPWDPQFKGVQRWIAFFFLDIRGKSVFFLQSEGELSAGHPNSLCTSSPTRRNIPFKLVESRARFPLDTSTRTLVLSFVLPLFGADDALAIVYKTYKSELVSVVPFLSGKPFIYTNNIDVARQVTAGGHKSCWIKPESASRSVL
jgi:hypothetical protein